MINAYNPYWWTPQASRCLQQRKPLLGIYEVTTSGVELNSDESTVDFGVNPAAFIGMPGECIILLTVSASVPDGGDDYPVYIIVPCGCTSTLNGTSGTSRLPLLDDTGVAITGADITEGLQKLALLDRRKGIIKFVTA